MKNLEILRIISCQHGMIEKGLKLCRDSAHDQIYFAQRGRIIAVSNPVPRSSEIDELCILNEVEVAVDGIPVALSYLWESESICVIYEDGDIWTVAVSDWKVECVGSVNGGIRAAAWSPDQELLVVVSGEGILSILTRDFDLLREISLQQDDFGAQKPISVGWGSKQTQFHGSEGKAAALKTPQVKNPCILTWDDEKIRISWRGDGQLLVISSVHPSLRVRQLRIFDREGSLQYTSEPVEGLGHQLSWQPSGGLIATTQKLPNKYQVAFFEKNGLRHGEFSLQYPEHKVEEVAWDESSSILSVLLEYDSEQKEQWLQFYTRGNYHWYLKQELRMSHSSSVLFLGWDSHLPLTLIVLGEDFYKEIAFAWATHSSPLTSDSHAFTAVIDGQNSLMTPFRDVIIPPPMSAYKLESPTPISAVAFPSFALCPSSDDIWIFSVDGSAILHAIEEKQTDEVVGRLECRHQEKLRVRISVEDSPEGMPRCLSLYWKWMWVAPDTFLCLTIRCTLCLWKLSEGTLHLREWMRLKDEVMCMGISKVMGFVILQLQDESLHQVSWGEGLTISQAVPFTSSLPPGAHTNQLEVWESKDSSDWHLFSVTDRGHLLLDGKKILGNVTSFLLGFHAFLATTTDHQLIVCFFYESPDLTIKAEDPLKRNIERGSRLVTWVLDETLVVLQTPRGNLEVIHPRPLVLRRITHLLEKEQVEYRESMQLLRRNRVNCNLLCDHDPKRFLASVPAFIQTLEPSLLVLFLSDLVEEIVVETMYKDYYDLDHVERASTWSDILKAKETKVDRICDALCRAMESQLEGKPDLLHPLLLTHARKSTPDWEGALRRIQHLRHIGEEKRGEEALKFLLYYVDVDELFDVSLGTYDFDLVLLVAAHSNKDPKEYIPFLNQLRILQPQAFRQYSIDIHLRRWNKALKNISQCGEEFFPACLELIREKTLYRHALHLFPSGSASYRSVCEAYGEYLEKKGAWKEAGILYSLAFTPDKAVKMYQKVLDWRSTYQAAMIAGFQGDQMKDLGESLGLSLRHSSRFKDAGDALLHFCGSEGIDLSVDAYLLGGHFSHAIQILAEHGKEEWMETKVKKVALELHKECIILIQRKEKSFQDHLDRLTLVRRVKAERLDKEESVPDGDLYSDASSTVSGSTSSAQTFRSMKSQRKLERKKYTLKEGSANEDLGIIVALHDLIRSTDALCDEVHEILETLVLFGELEKAELLQNTFRVLLKKMEKGSVVIWPQMIGILSNRGFGPDVTTEEAVRIASGPTGHPSDAVRLYELVERLEEHLKLLRVSEADLSLEGREALKSLVELALATGLEEGITRSRVIAVVTREQDHILETSQLLEEAREVSRQLEFAIQTVSKRIPQLERSIQTLAEQENQLERQIEERTQEIPHLEAQYEVLAQKVHDLEVCWEGYQVKPEVQMEALAERHSSVATKMRELVDVRERLAAYHDLPPAPELAALRLEELQEELKNVQAQVDDLTSHS